MVKKSYQSPVSVLLKLEIQKACLITSTSNERVLLVGDTYDENDFDF